LPGELAERTASVDVQEVGKLFRAIGKTRQALSRKANPLLVQVQLYFEMADALKGG